VATIEEVKAGLAQAAEEGNTIVGQARAAADSADRMVTRMRAVSQGTNHPKLAEAVSRAQQAKQRLAEAVTAAQQAAQAARDYMGILG
jgi:DNA-binding helix-hairpin-helix protein with protein kinase domain